MPPFAIGRNRRTLGFPHFSGFFKKSVRFGVQSDIIV